jgi:GxxExxY protein
MSVLTKVVGIAQHVYKCIGNGHSEAIYHRAMEVGLRKSGLKYESEKIVPVTYDQHVVGNVRIDLVISDDSIVELKSIAGIKQKEITQLENYMELTGANEGIVINFPTTPGSEVETHQSNIPLAELS